VWLDIGHILFVTSLFAALLAFHNTVARYAFALGRERVLPAWLGTTGRHNSAPKWGSVTQTVLAAVVLVIYAGFGLDPIVYLFFWLTVLGGLGVLILMTATSAAVVFFFGRRYDNRSDVGIWSRFVAPFIAFLGLGYVLFLTVDQFATLLGLPDPHSPWRWVLPASFAAAALAGMLWAVIIKLTRPAVYASIGLGANRVTTPDVMPVGGVR
jgi:amino acid transporter